MGCCKDLASQDRSSILHGAQHTGEFGSLQWLLPSFLSPLLLPPVIRNPYLQEVLWPGREEWGSRGCTHAPPDTSVLGEDVRPPCPGLGKRLCSSKLAETPVPAALLGGGQCVGPGSQPLWTVPRKGGPGGRLIGISEGEVRAESA